jgi:hypothetical protein
MSDLIPFVERTRWLMFKACATEGVAMRRFIADIGMPEKRVRDILFSEKADVGSLNLREIAEWFYCSVGKIPDFSLVPLGEWHSADRLA